MNWWQYLMLVNIYLLVFYSFYAILLSRETFFQLNRIYLVSAALLSFFIPLIQSDWVKNLFITQKVQYTIYSSPVLLYSFKPVAETHFTIGHLMVIVYLCGIAFLLVRFLLQLIALNKIINKPQQAAPYSFFKNVKLGEDSENNAIIEAHENVHARQWHSADVLIMEALMIINWFNPVVYLYRFAIKHIHEFIADKQALKSGTNKADYALLLLSQTFNAPAHQLVNPFFNKSLLKKRIIMLQKNKSQQVALIKYFLSAPLFILMLILSSATVNNSKAIRMINKKVETVLLIPAPMIAKTDSGAVKEKHFLTAANKVIPYIPQKAGLSTPGDTTPKKEGWVFTAVEHVPQFPGGISAFITFLSTNIRYPAEARKNNVQGRVIISFIVERDGTLSSIKIARGIGDGCDEEALRVLKLSPKWIPGTQNGKTVRVAYSVPINFALSLEDDKPAYPAGQKTGAGNVTKANADVSIVLNEKNKPVADTGKKIVDFTLSDYFNRSSPLYILDGKRIDNLNMVNPKDIESVSVLKNKSATALYGTEGVNGVVIVTTKKYAREKKANLFYKKLMQ